MKTVYQWTWLNGCVTYAEDYNTEQRADMERRYGKLIRKEEAI